MNGKVKKSVRTICFAAYNPGLFYCRDCHNERILGATVAYGAECVDIFDIMRVSLCHMAIASVRLIFVSCKKLLTLQCKDRELDFVTSRTDIDILKIPKERPISQNSDC